MQARCLDCDSGGIVVFGNATSECMCKSCQCDRVFAECFAEFPCPRMVGYLSKKECKDGEFNLTRFLNVHAN